MKIQRTKNATRNVAAGAALRIYQMIGPFILRTTMIHVLGMEYVGLNGLFTSILQVLNLAELGVGSAMVYSMYKPIAEDDTERICMLMKLYRLYYRIIGWVILGLGLIILPVIPKLISGDVPNDVNVYILYLLNLGATVLSYWLFAYKNSLLVAHQRNDVVDKITIATTTVQYVLQIGLLFAFKNYYLYVIVVLFSQVLLNLVTAITVDKMYPDYHPVGTIDKGLTRKINVRIKDLFTSKLGEVIVNSADTIVISGFLGLTVLATYNNYFYILTSVMSFVTLFFKATTAGIGNSLIVETAEKNARDLNQFTFMISWIGFFCSTCLMCLYQPFMELWVGEKYLLENGCVVCLSCYFYIRVINQVLIVYKDAAGMWHEDRFRPLCTALTNLVLNLILVQFMGIYGVLLSTVLSTLIVGLPWVIRNLFNIVIKQKPKQYICSLFQYATVAVLGCLITYILCIPVSNASIITIVVRLLICCIIPNSIYILVFHKKEEFRQSLGLVDRIIGTRVRAVHKIISQLVK